MKSPNTIATQTAAAEPPAVAEPAVEPASAARAPVGTHLARPACGCPSRLGCHVHGPQPREHAVLCRTCRRPTWAVTAICDRCAEQEGVRA